MQHQPSLTSVSWHPQQALALQQQLQQPTASAPPVLRSNAVPIGADLSSNASTAYEQAADGSAAGLAGIEDQMAMDEDVSGAAGLKSSSSAPDLHLLLEGALQAAGPRSLLTPREHFSGSTVGALVPYKGTEVRDVDRPPSLKLFAATLRGSRQPLRVGVQQDVAALPGR